MLGSLRKVKDSKLLKKMFAKRVTLMSILNRLRHRKNIPKFEKYLSTKTETCFSFQPQENQCFFAKITKSSDDDIIVDIMMSSPIVFANLKNSK